MEGLLPSLQCYINANYQLCLFLFCFVSLYFNTLTVLELLQIEQLMFDKYKLDWKNRVKVTN